MNWITLSEYGRIRGVTREAVRQAIIAGRLKNSVKQNEKGKWVVDPGAANIEWELATSHKHRPKHLGDTRPADYKPIVIPGMGKAADSDDPMQVTLAEAQRRAEVAKAEIQEIKLAQLKGELVPVAEVEAEAFKAARTVRDNMLNIPDRVAAEFAGITQSQVIHARLMDEIRKALEGLQGE